MRPSGELRKLLSCDSDNIVQLSSGSRGLDSSDPRAGDIVTLTTEALISIKTAHVDGRISQEEKSLLKRQILTKQAFDEAILMRMSEHRAALDKLLPPSREDDFSESSLNSVSLSNFNPSIASSKTIDTSASVQKMCRDNNTVSPNKNNSENIDGCVSTAEDDISAESYELLASPYQLRRQLSLESSAILDRFSSDNPFTSEIARALHFIRVAYDTGNITLDDKIALKKQILEESPLDTTILSKMSPDQCEFLCNLQFVNNSSTSNQKFLELTQSNLKIANLKVKSGKKNRILKVKTLFGDINFTISQSVPGDYVDRLQDENHVSAGVLKSMLCSITSFSENDLIVIRNGRSLSDDTLIDVDASNSTAGIFVIIKPSSTTPCNFDLKVTEDGKSKTHKALSFRANTKVFHLKREIFRLTKISEGSMRLILGARVLRDEYMLGDYILASVKKSHNISTFGPLSKSSKKNAPVATIFLTRKFDPKKEVDVTSTLRNGQRIKFSTPLGSPLSHIKEILTRQFHVPADFAAGLSFRMGSTELNDMSKSLYDYGKTDSSPIELEIFNQPAFSLCFGAGTESNGNSRNIPPSALQHEEVSVDSPEELRNLLTSMGIDIDSMIPESGVGVSVGTTEISAKRQSVKSNAKKATKPAQSLITADGKDESTAEGKGKSSKGGNGLFSNLKKGFLSSSSSTKKSVPNKASNAVATILTPSSGKAQTGEAAKTSGVIPLSHTQSSDESNVISFSNITSPDQVLLAQPSLPSEPLRISSDFPTSPSKQSSAKSPKLKSIRSPRRDNLASPTAATPSSIVAENEQLSSDFAERRAAPSLDALNDELSVCPLCRVAHSSGSEAASSCEFGVDLQKVRSVALNNAAPMLSYAESLFFRCLPAGSDYNSTFESRDGQRSSQMEIMYEEVKKFQSATFLKTMVSHGWDVSESVCHLLLSVLRALEDTDASPLVNLPRRVECFAYQKDSNSTALFAILVNRIKKRMEMNAKREELANRSSVVKAKVTVSNPYYLLPKEEELKSRPAGSFNVLSSTYRFIRIHQLLFVTIIRMIARPKLKADAATIKPVSAAWDGIFDKALPQLERCNWKLTKAVRKLKQGERDLEELTDDLDPNSSAVIEVLLSAVLRLESDADAGLL